MIGKHFRETLNKGELRINRVRINRSRSVFGNCFLLSNSSLSKCSLNELASKGVKFQWKFTLRWLTSLHPDWLVIDAQRTMRIQESIPVGCVPSAAVAISGVESAQGGVCPGEGGLSSHKDCLPRGFYLVEICPGGVCLWGCTPCRQKSWQTLVKTSPFRNYCCRR